MDKHIDEYMVLIDNEVMWEGNYKDMSHIVDTWESDETILTLVKVIRESKAE